MLRLRDIYGGRNVGKGKPQNSKTETREEDATKGFLAA